MADKIIPPGDDDVVTLARAHDGVRAALLAALQACGLDDIAQAQARSKYQCRKLAQQALGIAAPRGMDVLRGEFTQTKSRIETAQAAQDRIPAAAAGVALSIEEAEAEQATQKAWLKRNAGNPSRRKRARWRGAGSWRCSHSGRLGTATAPSPCQSAMAGRGSRGRGTAFWCCADQR